MHEKVDFRERDFFKEPFTEAEIKEIIGNGSPADMFSFKSPSFKKTGLERASLEDGDLIRLMLKEPRLIKRPVVRIGDNVYFGANVNVLKEIV